MITVILETLDGVYLEAFSGLDIAPVRGDVVDYYGVDYLVLQRVWDLSLSQVILTVKKVG